MSLPRPMDSYDADMFRRAFDDIETRLKSLEAAAHAGYVITNQPTSLRTLDGTSGSAASVLQFVATVVKDLKTKGVLAK